MKPKSVLSKRRLTSVGSNKSSHEYDSSKVSSGSMSSAESIVSFVNSNIEGETDEELGFSSDSDFEEHAYSLSKKIKLSETENCSLNRSISITSRLKNRISSPTASKSNSTGDQFSCNVAFSSRSKRESKCNSKNAVMARMNRLKKKKYIEDLEARNQKLEAESKILKQLLSSRLELIDKLKRETSNLRSVIKNSSEIGKLLQCIHKNTNLQISSSLFHSFKAKPDSTEISSHETTSPTTASRATSKNVGAEEDSEFPCEKFDEPCLSPSLDFNFFPEFDSSLLVRCETPSNGIDSNDTKDPLFEEVGVCFHVANNKVSLEFCESCNFKASFANN